MNTYLKQHPEIFMAKKESHFFATDLNAPHFTKDKDKYLALFSKAGDEKRIGEASVMYLYSRQAASKIKEFCPRARIIIMLRNPVDMMYTLHRHNVYHGSENLIDFEVALNAEKERKKGLRIPKNVRLVEGLFYRELAKYTQQVKRYLDVFGQENVFVVIYDEFKNNTPKVYKRTLQFLEVNDNFQPEFSIINPEKEIRIHSLHRFLKNKKVQSLLDTVISCPIRLFFEKALTRLNTQHASDPQYSMDLNLRRRLQAEFAAEVESLSKLLGRDLTYWTKTV